MPRIDEVYPDKFLKPAALEGETFTYTIVSIEMGKVGDKEKGEEKAQVVLGFAETDKLLGLNKTNATVLGKLYGLDTDDWMNQIIVIFPTETPYQGRMVDTIRVNETLTRKKNQAMLKAATAPAAKSVTAKAQPAGAGGRNDPHRPVSEAVLAPDEEGASDQDIPF